MGKWLAELPEWVSGGLFVVGLPVLMLAIEALLHKRAPHWRHGKHNDATAIMLSVAAVVYSVAIGLCVVTLWDRMESAQSASGQEATNLAAVAEGSRVCEPARAALIRSEVIQYNRDVVNTWDQRRRGIPTSMVSRDLDRMMATVGAITPTTEAQKAFVQDAFQRLTAAVQLRADALRAANEQKLPNLIWIAVIGGSAVVLSLCLTCGVQEGWIRRILMVGVTVIVGINLFIVTQLNYPFFGSVSVKPTSYTEVISLLERES